MIAFVLAWALETAAGLQTNVTSRSGCVPPIYEVTRDVINRTSGWGAMNIRIEVSDLTVRGLLCLAEKLKADHPEWTDVTIRIFTSELAASNYDGTAADPDASHGLRALYSLERAARKEQLFISPIGDADDESYDTVFELPVDPDTAKCKLDIDGRCLFELNQIQFPDDVLEDGISAAVTLVATLKADGQVIDVRPVLRNQESSAMLRLARWSRQNLESWRFEAANTDKAIQMTYDFRVDRSLPPNGVPKIEFALPDRVTIRANRQQ